MTTTTKTDAEKCRAAADHAVRVAERADRRGLVILEEVGRMRETLDRFETAYYAALGAGFRQPHDREETDR